MLAGRALKKIQEKTPGLEVEIVEVATAPLRSWHDGIRMIPTLRGGGKTLSGLTLSPKKIRSFVKNINTDL